MAFVPLIPDDGPRMVESLGRDAFATKIARRTARPPPSGAAAFPADLRVQAELFSLLRGAAETFAAPDADAKAMTQAAVDYTHAAALRHVVAGAMVPRIGAAPALLAAAGLEGATRLPAPDGAAPERDLLVSVVLVNQALVSSAASLLSISRNRKRRTQNDETRNQPTD